MLSENKKLFIRIILTALAIGCVGFFGVVVILQSVFSGDITLPQNIHLGSFRIQFYGIILGLAALAGYWLASKRREKFGITVEQSDLIILLLIIFGFIGARVYHVFSKLPYYLENPVQILQVWNGGLSIFGSIIAGVIVLFIYSRYAEKGKKSLLSLLDWLTPSLVLGHIIGRFGNFLNYELYGLPTNLPWKMFVPIQFRIPPFEINQFFHPVFLYEASGSLIIFYLLLKLKLKPGQLFLMWLFLYNVLRFFLEFIRAESIIYSGFRINAIVSALAVAIAIYVWYRLYYRRKLIGTDL